MFLKENTFMATGGLLGLRGQQQWHSLFKLNTKIVFML